MATPNYDLPTIAGGNVTDIVDAVNGLANATDTALKEVADSPAPYVLKPATPTVLGGIKVGQNLTVLADGTLNASASGGGGIPDDNSVTTGKIVNGAVTGDKLASGAVTSEKLATSLQAAIADATTNSTAAINKANAMGSWQDFSVTINSGLPNWQASRQFCTFNAAINVMKLGIVNDLQVPIGQVIPAGTYRLCTLPAEYRPTTTRTLIDMGMVRGTIVKVVSPQDLSEYNSYHPITIAPNGEVSIVFASPREGVTTIMLQQFPITTDKWGLN